MNITLYFPPCEPWCTQGIFFIPLITTVPKWGFPSLFQLFLLSGSRKTSHKCKIFHFLELHIKNFTQILYLFASGHHGVTSSSTECSIQKGERIRVDQPSCCIVALTNPTVTECTRYCIDGIKIMIFVISPTAKQQEAKLSAPE